MKILPPNRKSPTLSPSSSLSDEYFEAEASPASIIYDFTHKQFNSTEKIELDSEDVSFGHEISLGDGNDEKNGRVFLIPNLLTEDECDNLIQEAERVGIEKPNKSAGTLRTAKRTKQYVNKELSKKIDEYIVSEIEKNADNNFLKDNLGEFYGTHANWRLLRYDPGDKFPAHQDQMDTLQIQNEDGSKGLCASSHTLIVNISPDGVKGGNLRFYPKSRLGLKSNNVLRQYQHSVDVRVPRGWAVVFRQKGLIHAGQPVDIDSPLSKYIAQAGFLRKVPPGDMIRPSVFRHGPGLEKYRT